MKSFDNLFYPKSIAIIGASSKPGNLSYELVGNLLKFNFTGKIYPINPKSDVVNKLKAYKSVTDVAEDIDLAFIMVPKALVLNAIDDCHKKGINSVILITAGFKETGEEGEKLENELLAKIKNYNINLVGPNCMGIINSKPEVSMNGTFILGNPLFGGIGFCSQSGALGAAVLKTIQQNDIGLGQFISIGNKADVTENVILRYWKDNPDIKVITLYLESFSNPRDFMFAAKEVTKSKPIILIKAAKTNAGMKAASSHTGALASADAIANAFIEQSGILRVNTVEEMFDVAKAFDKAKMPKGNRVGILTNAGGPAILCVDECDKMGLEVPELQEKTKNLIAQFAHPEASLHNPVDLLPPATAEMWADAAKCMIDDETIDALIVIMGPPLMYDTVEIMKAVNQAVINTEKSVLFTMMSQDENLPRLQSVAPVHPPLFKFPEPPARALGEMLKFKKWRAREIKKKIKFEVRKERVQEIIDSKNIKGEFYLEFQDVYEILKCYGLPIIESVSVSDESEAVKTAQKLEYPVVLKCIGKELIHKTDIGGVKLNIKNESEILESIKVIKDNLSSKNLLTKLEGFLLQPYYKGGIETILGIINDKNAGHLVMFGLGGILVEILKDVKFRLAGIDETDAFEMIQSLKGYDILKGIRGNEGIDIDFAAENLVKLSRLALDFPCIEELDLNPFVFSNDRNKCKILDARIKLSLK